MEGWKIRKIEIRRAIRSVIMQTKEFTYDEFIFLLDDKVEINDKV